MVDAAYPWLVRHDAIPHQVPVDGAIQIGPLALPHLAWVDTGGHAVGIVLEPSTVLLGHVNQVGFLGAIRDLKHEGTGCWLCPGGAIFFGNGWYYEAAID